MSIHAAPTALQPLESQITPSKALYLQRHVAPSKPTASHEGSYTGARGQGPAVVRLAPRGVQERGMGAQGSGPGPSETRV
jgi:hypothetical protein